MFYLSPLPYNKNDLEPYMSAQTLDFHYDKHHRTYLDNLNNLIKDIPDFQDKSLDDIVLSTWQTPQHTAIFNNAAQVWNHDFFWKSMKAGGGGQPSSLVLEKIVKNFGSYDDFCEKFCDTGIKQFGSGWVWLVKNEEDDLEIIKTSNAELPMVYGKKALLTCDVWEHAYYLDYQNRRKIFLQTFLTSLVNWDFVSSNF